MTQLFQHGAQGTCLHDLVWGLFAFGDRFGGSFVRMQPHGGNTIVNSKQGAIGAAAFEIAAAGTLPAAEPFPITLLASRFHDHP